MTCNYSMLTIMYTSACLLMHAPCLKAINRLIENDTHNHRKQMYIISINKRHVQYNNNTRTTTMMGSDYQYTPSSSLDYDQLSLIVLMRQFYFFCFLYGKIINTSCPSKTREHILGICETSLCKEHHISTQEPAQSSLFIRRKGVSDDVSNMNTKVAQNVTSHDCVCVYVCECMCVCTCTYVCVGWVGISKNSRSL